MMAASRALKYPDTSNRSDGKSILWNKIIDKLKKENAGFSDSSLAAGKGFVKVLTDTLWKVTYSQCNFI